MGRVAWVVCRFLAIVALVVMLVPAVACAQRADGRHQWNELNGQTVKAYGQGQYDVGVRAAEAALTFARKAFGPRDPDTLTSMNNLALLYMGQGRYGDAEPLYREALQTSREMRGPRNPDTLASMHNLARLYEDQGRYGEAELLFREVLQAVREALGPLHPDTLITMSSLAGLYEDQGRYSDAEPLYREVLQTSRKLLGPRHPDTLTSMDNLATLYDYQGRYGEAEPLFREALQTRREVLGPHHRDTLASMNELAFLYVNQGRYGDAKPLLRDALQTSRDVLGPRDPKTLSCMNNLADLYELEGRYDEAAPLFREVLQTRREVLGPGHPDTLLTQLSGVINLVALGRQPDAVRQLSAMEPNLLAWLGTGLKSSAARGVRSGLVASQANYQDIAINLALQPGADTEAAATAASAVLRFKGLQADEEAHIASIVRRGPDRQAQALAIQIAALRSQLAAQFNNAGKPAYIEQLLRDLDTRELSLGRLNRRFAAQLQLRKANLRDLQNALPSRSALLEFRQYHLADFQHGKLLAPRWAGLLVSADSITVLDLGSVASTPDQAATIAADLDGPRGRWAARDLYDQLFGKLATQLASLNRLYIAPDGALNLVPFGALLDPGGQRLAQRLDIRLLQTGRDLLRSQTDRPAKGLLAFGGVDFDAAPDTTPVSATPATEPPDELFAGPITTTELRLRTAGAFRQGFTPLPATQDEIEAIGRQYRTARRDETVELWHRSDASKARLEALPEPPRVLHLATQSFYRAADQPEDRPMLLAGVALAGANRALHDAGQDGILYAIDAPGLNLEGTELVVLSACETAQGQIDYGEGISGLVRALRAAGARYVLVALRPVSDASGSSFVQRFYFYWLGQTLSDPPAALRLAQQEAIRTPAKNKPDTTWAQFILVGG